MEYTVYYCEGQAGFEQINTPETIEAETAEQAIRIYGLTQDQLEHWVWKTLPDGGACLTDPSTGKRYERSIYADLLDSMEPEA